MGYAKRVKAFRYPRLKAILCPFFCNSLLFGYYLGITSLGLVKFLEIGNFEDWLKRRKKVDEFKQAQNE